MTDERDDKPETPEPATPPVSPAPPPETAREKSEPTRRRRSHRPPPIADEQRAEILRLSTEVRWGTRQIAKSLGLSRSRVRTVLDSVRPEKSNSGQEEEAKIGARASYLDPFRLAIAERVSKGITTSRILREIRAEGYEGSRTILAEHVRSIRPKRVARREQAKRRFETPKGQEIQSDFGVYRVDRTMSPNRTCAPVKGST